MPREFGQVVRPVSDAGVVPRLRDAHARKQFGAKDITVAVLLVEDDPHGLDGIAGAFALEQTLSERHVVGRLVDEPVAGLVDDQRTGQRPLGQHHHRRAAGQRCDRGEPPRLVHEIDCGADVLGDADRVAGVGLGAEARVFAERLGLKLPPHVHAVVETARGQHDPAARRHGDLASVVLDDGAGDPGAVSGQPRPTPCPSRLAMPARSTPANKPAASACPPAA